MEQEKISPRKETYQFPHEAISNIAQAMVEISLKVQPGEKVLILYDPMGKQLVEEISKRCRERKTKLTFFERDIEYEVNLAMASSLAGLEDYFLKQKELIENSDAVFLIRGYENPEIFSKISPERDKIYSEKWNEAHKKRFDGSIRWSLICLPTRYEAKIEGIEYSHYFNEFFEACNQPWEKIKKAQVKLVEKLNKGKKLELIVNPNDPDNRKRTDLVMSIEGMTFINSTIDMNFPGSEVYSAPVLNSVNGQLYVPGKYLYDGKLMKDIYLKVKGGKIIEAFAKRGNKHLQEILSQGEGARYFGEVAFGTNPGLTRRFFNDLLNEKVGGSFHMAAGHCFEDKRFEGIKVNVNNGNTSDKTPVHWDLTLLMHPQFGGGKVILDGEVIQENGKFLDPELAILNPKI